MSDNEKTHRICLWSGPRNVSTAIMYSFAQRSDTRVVDEPLYAHYLKISGADHPGAEEIINYMESDGDLVVRNIILGRCDKDILFIKQMTHHLIDIDRNFLNRTINPILIRDPWEMLPSLAGIIKNPTLKDTGLLMQYNLYRELTDMGQDPPIIDSMQLLIDPTDVLNQLCFKLKIPFRKSMMNWSNGGLPEDGIWAKYWYKNVHRSTGFQPYREKTDSFPVELKPLFEECRDYYHFLAEKAIKSKKFNA